MDSIMPSPGSPPEYVGQSFAGSLYVGDTVKVDVGSDSYAAEVVGLAPLGATIGLRITPEGTEKTRIISFELVSEIIKSPVRRRLRWEAKPECGKCKFWTIDKPAGVNASGDCRRYPAMLRKTCDEWCGEYVFKQPENKAKQCH